MNRTTLPRFTLVAAAMLVASPVFAQGKTLSIDAPTHAQLTMAQAVVIAESMVGNGRATRVRLEDRAAQPVYRVTLHSPGASATRIDVAHANGRIVASERTKD